MRKLCFGSFARILILCKNQTTTQKSLVGTILLSIVPGYDIRSDDTAVSDLVRCESNLSPTVTDAAQGIDIILTSERIESTVMPLIDENKKGILVLAMKALIENDKEIEPNTNVERINGLSKETILAKDSFVYVDFITGILLYTLTVKNHVGKENVEHLNEEYIEKFYDKRHEIGFVSTYANLNFDDSTDIPNDLHLMTLLTETGGKCHMCTKPLAYIKNGREVYHGEIVEILEDEDVVLCVSCARDAQTLTDAEKHELLNSKRELENRIIALESISHINLEKQIESVLREIDGIEDTGNLGLKNAPVKVEDKILEPRLKDKAVFHVTRMYEAVNSALDRMSGENKLNVNKFAKNIRRVYEDTSETISSQSEIYNILVEWLYEKSGYKYKEACEIIISYFVQRCEVFDEIAK